MQNRVAALRPLLAGTSAVIDTVDPGYVLRVADDALDALLFERLVAQGRGAGDPALLRQALALWRGPVADGLGGTALARMSAGLAEQRLAALEECIELELAAGLPDTAVDELRRLVAEHPRRERFVGQLVVALARGGQRAEAAAVYQRSARRRPR